MKLFSLLLVSHVFLLSAAFLLAARPDPQTDTFYDNGPGFGFGFIGPTPRGGFRTPRSRPGNQMDPWYYQNGPGFGFMGMGGGFGGARMRPQMDTGSNNGPDFGFMGPGMGFGLPGGGLGDGMMKTSMVCEMEGPCYKKMLTCPDKCFSSFSKSGQGYGYGGGQGGCNFDCKDTCSAFC